MNLLGRIESPDARLPRPAEIWAARDRHIASNGVVAFLFAATGPLALYIAVAQAGGMAAPDIASWVFGGYALGGALTIVMTLLYRMPVPCAWTMPGMVLLLDAWDHLPFDQIVGAFHLSGLLMIVLALTGWVRRIMEAIPMPVVMGMVAGVFLHFGLNIIDAFVEELWLAAVTTMVFGAVLLLPRIGRVFPPVLAALLVGFGLILAMGRFELGALGGEILSAPKFYAPSFTLQAALELVVPLTLTVVGIQNAQGTAVLQGAGFKPPVNGMALACGLGSILFALVGAVLTCVTGPSNAIINSAGPREKRFTGALVFGLCMIALGVFAPVAIDFALALPMAFIALLGGLAMLPILESAFKTAFSGDFSLGALVTFLVTVSGITIFNIGAAFWGLVFGFLVSAIFERAAFARRRAERKG